MAEELEQSLINQLVEIALDARKNSYAPYSNYRVGSALLCDDGINIYPGCNIENASYPCGLCAERVALAKLYLMATENLERLPLLGPVKKYVLPVDCAVRLCLNLLLILQLSVAEVKVITKFTG